MVCKSHKKEGKLNQVGEDEHKKEQMNNLVLPQVQDRDWMKTQMVIFREHFSLSLSLLV